MKALLREIVVVLVVESDLVADRSEEAAFAEVPIETAQRGNTLAIESRQVCISEWPISLDAFFEQLPRLVEFPD